MPLLPVVIASMVAVAAAQMPEHRLDVETYDLGLTDTRVAAQAVQPLLSPEGRVVEDAANHRIIVVDVPSVHRAVRAALQRVVVTTRNVRVGVTFRWQATSDHVGAQAGGRVTPRGGNITLSGEASDAQSKTTSRQELVVLSGGTASLRIADEVPYSDWFWTWGVGRGLWVEGTRWRDVASGMDIEPFALPDGKIRLRLTPYFEYFIDGSRQATRLHQLTTEVIANDGEEMTLGGVPANDTEFRDRFLIGFDRQRGTSQASISVRATVE
jgi:type II secretory pathway component HofQ